MKFNIFIHIIFLIIVYSDETEVLFKYEKGTEFGHPLDIPWFVKTQVKNQDLEDIISKVLKSLSFNIQQINQFKVPIADMIRFSIASLAAQIQLSPFALTGHTAIGSGNETLVHSSQLFGFSHMCKSFLGGKYGIVLFNLQPRIINLLDSNSIQQNNLSKQDNQTCLLYDYKFEYQSFKCSEDTFINSFYYFDINHPDPFFEFDQEMLMQDESWQPNRYGPNIRWVCTCHTNHKMILFNIRNLRINIWDENSKESPQDEDHDMDEIQTEQLSRKDNFKQRIIGMKDTDSRFKQVDDQVEKQLRENKNLKIIEKEENTNEKKNKRKYFKDLFYSESTKSKEDDDRFRKLLADINKKENNSEKVKMDQQVGLLKIKTQQFTTNNTIKNSASSHKDKVQEDQTKFASTRKLTFQLREEIENIDMTDLFVYIRNAKFINLASCDWTHTKLQQIINQIIVKDNLEKFMIIKQPLEKGETDQKGKPVKGVSLSLMQRAQVRKALTEFLKILEKFKGCFSIVNTQNWFRYDFRETINRQENKLKEINM